LPPETLFLMGRLAEHHLGETQQARKTLARAWRKVNGKRWKALRARMQELSEGASAAQAAAMAAAREEALPPAAAMSEPGPSPAPPGSRPLRH
jgi:hypothetical protein